MQPTDCNVLSSCYLSLHIPGCDRPMLARESLGYDIKGHIVAPSWLPRAPRLATRGTNTSANTADASLSRTRP